MKKLIVAGNQEYITIAIKSQILVLCGKIKQTMQSILLQNGVPGERNVKSG